MRLTLTLILVAGSLVAQASNRTFYFTHPLTADTLNSMTTLVRTVVDIRDLATDPAHNALVASNGTVDQLMATDWIVGQLDSDGKTQPAEFKMAPSGDVIRVF